jgi:hypothetical protein
MNMSDQKQSVSSNKSKQKQKPVTSGGNSMDTKNKKALNVLQTEGEKTFIEHVFTGDNGERLSYAEMRMRYG